LFHTTASFAKTKYGSANFFKLKDSLKAALVSEGLFDDEANALLKTWEASYFKSSGMRVFFLCPRAWTDYYLPLQISLPAQINRVMVGRIELVTPEQREKLRKLAAFSPGVIEDLGRFRNALILDEEKKRPTPALADFMTLYHLQPISPSTSATAKN
jgi:hypothetical protein